jgi:UDP-N-acetylmuramyl pentapeptide phosphotransferase/UDP-N-acetylglucosamine-1-phosphate transferase
LGWLIVPLFAFAIVATSNAVNISDGLDGLGGRFGCDKLCRIWDYRDFSISIILSRFLFYCSGRLLSYLVV